MPEFPCCNAVILAAVEVLPVAMIVVSESGDIVFANTKTESLLGYEKDELCGRSINELLPPRYRVTHEKLRAMYMEAPSLRSMSHGRILPALKKSGQEVQVELGLSPMMVEGSRYVLTSIIELSNTILQVAPHEDPLTGLPNRILFRELSENLRILAARNRTHLALMYIDLDGFKNVNDDYGHEVGDEVLCEVANILRKGVRKNDALCRIGGDEFVVCCYGITDNTDLENIARKLIQEISAVTNPKARSITLSASVGGVNLARPEDVMLDEAIRTADKLMYKAKRAGGADVFSLMM